MQCGTFGANSLFDDLDELGRASATDAPMPFLFCVVSRGCAAKQCLANKLNAHPDIYCVHCVNQFSERLGGARSMDGCNIYASSVPSCRLRAPAAICMECSANALQIWGKSWAKLSTAPF